MQPLQKESLGNSPRARLACYEYRAELNRLLKPHVDVAARAAENILILINKSILNTIIL